MTTVGRHPYPQIKWEMYCSNVPSYSMKWIFLTDHWHISLMRETFQPGQDLTFIEIEICIQMAKSKRGIICSNREMIRQH